MNTTKILPTADIVHGWRRRPKGRWIRVASGSSTEVAAALEEFGRKNPRYCDQYTGQKDPNVPIFRKGK